MLTPTDDRFENGDVPLFVTVARAAQLLGVSRRFLEVHYGHELPRVRLGRCTRVERAAVVRIAQRLLESAPTPPSRA